MLIILVGAFALFNAVGLPILINKSTEGRADRLKKYLRETWLLAGIILVASLLLQKEWLDFAMKNRLSFSVAHPIWAYILVAILTASLGCLYWFALGKAAAVVGTEKPTAATMSPDEFATLLAEKLKSGAAGAPIGVLPTPDQMSGFVQFENKSFSPADAPTINKIWVGKVLRINFSFANRGLRKVFDNQSWGLIAFVDPTKNPGTQLHSVLLDSIKAGYDKFKGGGSELGAGMTGWNTAVAYPLTPEQVVGLKKGTIRVHLLLGGAWTDEEGKRFYWIDCQWTDWPQVPLDKSVWHES